MSNIQPGPRNSLTDIDGLLVGNAEHSQLRSGTTVVTCPEGTVASVKVLGGAPGTRETDLLDPVNSMETVNGIVLSGGSAFGLDAASGVQAALRERGSGYIIAGQCIPIVPAAIIFDLANGGDKNWDRFPPYRELGYQAAQSASADFEMGTAGAGFGALTAGLKGGLGTASAVLPNGVVVAALVAVNAVGAVNIGKGRHFWAAPFELNNEFGGLGLPDPLPEAMEIPIKFREYQSTGMNTTIGIIATDAALTKSEAKRLAINAHDGFSRAIWPAHTPFDGDLVFSLATGIKPRPANPIEMIELCTAGAMTMARAIARGVFAANPAPGDLMPAWSTL